MSRKSDARKAALAAAKRRAVLPILLSMTVILEEAWTKEGTTDHGVKYEALHMSQENKDRVAKKWQQIARWRTAYVDKHQEEFTQLHGSGAIYRDMEEKHNIIERAIMSHVPDGISYGHALSVETMLVSAFLDDWGEQQGWNVSREYLYLRRTMQTLAQWTCPPGDSLVLLMNMAYYDCRDRILENPDWSTMWQDTPMSETEEWIAAHPDADFSKAAQTWCQKTFHREVRAA